MHTSHTQAQAEAGFDREPDTVKQVNEQSWRDFDMSESAMMKKLQAI